MLNTLEGSKISDWRLMLSGQYVHYENNTNNVADEFESQNYHLSVSKPFWSSGISITGGYRYSKSNVERDGYSASMRIPLLENFLGYLQKSFYNGLLIDEKIQAFALKESEEAFLANYQEVFLDWAYSSRRAKKIQNYLSTYEKWLLNAKLIKGSDRLRFNTLTAQMQLQLSRSRTRLEKVMITVNSVGSDTDFSKTLPVFDFSKLPAVSKDYLKMDSIAKLRFSKVYELELELAQYNLHITKRRFLPSLEMYVRAQNSDNETKSISTDLSLSHTLGNQHNRNRAKSNELAIQRIFANREEDLLRYQSQIQRLYKDIDKLRQDLDILRVLSKNLQRIAQADKQLYARGKVPAHRVVDSIKESIGTDLELLEAQWQYHQLYTLYLAMTDQFVQQ